MDVVSPPPLRSHCSVVYLRVRDNSNLWKCAYQALSEPSRVRLYTIYGCVEYSTVVVHSADTMTTTTNLSFSKNDKFRVTDAYEWRNYRIAAFGTERAYQKQAIRWTGHVRKSVNRCVVRCNALQVGLGKRRLGRENVVANVNSECWTKRPDCVMAKIK